MTQSRCCCIHLTGAFQSLKSLGTVSTRYRLPGKKRLIRCIRNDPRGALLDGKNRISTTAGVTYTYDGDGERVAKSSGTLYWGLASNEPLAESDLSGTLSKEFIFFGGKRIARLDLPGGAVHYYFSDHLGSSNVVTNADGTTIEEESDYYPFGGERVLTDLLPDQRYKFTGKERDQESGLDYFGARYYSSSLGRFLTPDWAAAPTAVPYADFGNPQSLNLYGYVKNNPLNATDLDGHGELWEAIKASHIFFAKEIRGAFNATVVPAAKLQLSLANGQAATNIAETIKLSITKPGAIAEAGKEAVAQAGSTLKAVGQGNPDAIGATVATAATLAAPFAKGAPAAGAAAEVGEETIAGTNVPGQLTSRSSLRKGTIQDAWDNAADGPTGGKSCPTCSQEVQGNPAGGQSRGWDVHHDPSWTQRQFSSSTTRRQVIDSYQEGTSLRCVHCNRSDNQPH